MLDRVPRRLEFRTLDDDQIDVLIDLGKARAVVEYVEILIAVVDVVEQCAVDAQLSVEPESFPAALEIAKKLAGEMRRVPRRIESPGPVAGPCGKVVGLTIAAPPAQGGFGLNGVEVRRQQGAADQISLLTLIEVVAHPGGERQIRPQVVV